MRKYLINGFTIFKNRPVVVKLIINQLNKSTGRKGHAKLKKIYAQIPKTKCLKCGECCHWYRVAPVYSVEYFNILNYIKKNFTPDVISKFYAFAKINLGSEQIYGDRKKRPKKWRTCIFLDTQNRTCKIYECRPFVCRFYGLTKFDNYKKIKSLFPKCTFLNKKDNKMLEQETIDLYWKEINNLSDYFISTFKKDIGITKSQDLNNWFLV